MKAIERTSDVTRNQEKQLIRDAVDGSDAAYRKLYETYHSNVVAVVRRRVSDPDVVEDLIQQSFIRAFNALPTFRGDSAFGTWITRIAINVCLSHKRSERVRQNWVTLLEDVEYAKAAMSEATREESPEAYVQNRERRELVLQGIDRLPERYRKAIWLRYVKDLSYEEIVQTLEVPMGTVKTWLNRARRQLGREFRRLGLQAA
jgi:RNA polymerase sigma-70 factor (ECF subfamily)